MNREKRKIIHPESSDLASIITAVNCFAAVYKSSKNTKEDISMIFLRNFTVDGIDPFLKLYLYNSGIHPNIAYGQYDNMNQEIIDKSSILYAGKPHIIVLSLILEHLDQDFLNPGWNKQQAQDRLIGLFDLLKANVGSLIAVNTFIPPFYSEYGILAHKYADDKILQIQDLNLIIRKYVRDNPSQFFLFDWEKYARILGEDKSMDYRYWYLSKAPFRKDFLALYSKELAALCRTLKGKIKKCLVIDCDNTLWGGIIGEDGINGIKLNNDTYPGKCYYDFQKVILNLKNRGVIIALCSKNNEEDVWEVLDDHKDCPLKRSHISGFRINWKNKADNIKSLSEELNLGLESFVLVDDSPAECEMVKQLLPDVAVLQVPKNICELPQLLLKEGLFEALSINQEDRERTKLYRDEIIRKKAESQFENLDDYLASLGLTAKIHAAKPNEIPRVAQLTNKTNQFNLTVHRYSEIDIKDFTERQDSKVFSMSAKDRFGDFGLTGVLIFFYKDGLLVIDSLLISCRILGRKLEFAFVNYCLDHLEKYEKRWAFKTIEAKYVPAKKNQQVATFWDRMGFSLVKDEQGVKIYRIDKNKRTKESVKFIKIAGD